MFQKGRLEGQVVIVTGEVKVSESLFVKDWTTKVVK
jgi:hypothetical protein